MTQKTIMRNAASKSKYQIIPISSTYLITSAPLYSMVRNLIKFKQIDLNHDLFKLFVHTNKANRPYFVLALQNN